MTFLANTHFILQISHAKTFTIKYTRCPLVPIHTIILSKNIHIVTKTDYVWFEILWIRHYFALYVFYGITVEFEIQMRHLEIFGPVVDKRPNHYCDRITPQQQSNF